MKSRPKKINGILSNSHHLSKLIQISRQQEQILYTIKQLLEPQIAQHCISAHYSTQCLKLFTDSSVWASRLRFQSRSLAKQLAAHNLVTRKIDVRVIPKSLKQATFVKKMSPAHKISSTAAENIIQTAEILDDTELKAALKKLAKSVTRPGNS